MRARRTSASMDRQGKKLLHTYVLNNDFDYFLELVEPYKRDLTVLVGKQEPPSSAGGEG